VPAAYFVGGLFVNQAKGSAGSASAIQVAERGAHKAFVDLYRACHNFPHDVEKDMERYCKRFGRPIPKNFYEREQALWAMACRELRRVKNTLSGLKARRLVAEKFDGFVIGRVNGKDILLRMSHQSLYRITKRKLPQTGPWPAPPPTSRRAMSEDDNAFIADYTAHHFEIDLGTTLAQFRKKYARIGPVDWQERRFAVLLAACVELDAVKQHLSGGKARKLIVAKYRHAPLGQRSKPGHEVLLRLSSSSLRKYHKIGAHLPGGSPDELRMAYHRCGRRRSQP
jgi:hypothetical protein